MGIWIYFFSHCLIPLDPWQYPFYNVPTHAYMLTIDLLPLNVNQVNNVVELFLNFTWGIVHLDFIRILLFSKKTIKYTLMWSVKDNDNFRCKFDCSRKIVQFLWKILSNLFFHQVVLKAARFQVLKIRIIILFKGFKTPTCNKTYLLIYIPTN